MSEKLKPCTCGGIARVIVDYSYGRKGYCVQCQDCNRGTGTYYTKEDTVKAWNDMCERYKTDARDQTAKADKGKAQIHYVPPQIILDIAEVREYGVAKYQDPENWKRVEIERYIDAIGRHYIAMLYDPLSVDEESGLAHYKHIACNVAFLCELLKEAER